MSLGVVNYGELFQLNVANKCNGYIGEVVGAAINPANGIVSPLPDICTYYVLAFLEPLPACPWSSARRLPGGGVFHRPAHPHGAAVYYYWADARLMLRISVQTTDTGKGKNKRKTRSSREMESIFKREREEEARQLEAAKASRDRIFAEMFRGD